MADATVNLPAITVYADGSTPPPPPPANGMGSETPGGTPDGIAEHGGLTGDTSSYESGAGTTPSQTDTTTTTPSNETADTATHGDQPGTDTPAAATDAGAKDGAGAGDAAADGETEPKKKKSKCNTCGGKDGKDAKPAPPRPPVNVQDDAIHALSILDDPVFNLLLIGPATLARAVGSLGMAAFRGIGSLVGRAFGTGAAEAVGTGLATEAGRAAVTQMWEGGASTVVREGSSVVKTVKSEMLVRNAAGEAVTVTLTEVERAALATETIELSNMVAKEIPGIVPEMTSAGAGTIKQPFAEGLTYAELLANPATSAEARVLAADQTFALEQRAANALGIDVDGTGTLANGMTAFVDRNMQNFRFEPNGAVKSWFDPIGVHPPVP